MHNIVHLFCATVTIHHRRAHTHTQHAHALTKVCALHNNAKYINYEPCVTSTQFINKKYIKHYGGVVSLCSFLAFSTVTLTCRSITVADPAGNPAMLPIRSVSKICRLHQPAKHQQQKKN